jgi:hypothetical protein
MGLVLAVLPAGSFGAVRSCASLGVVSDALRAYMPASLGMIARSAMLFVLRFIVFRSRSPTLHRSTALGAEFNGVRYILYASNKDFKDAVYAASLSEYAGRRGHIASVTAANRNFLINTLGVRNAWIGGTDNVVEGTFRWIDGPLAGQLVPSTYWRTGEPNNYNNQDCICIWSDGGFADLDCGNTYDYLVAYPESEAGFCTSVRCCANLAAMLTSCFAALAVCFVLASLVLAPDCVLSFFIVFPSSLSFLLHCLSFIVFPSLSFLLHCLSFFIVFPSSLGILSGRALTWLTWLTWLACQVMYL